MISNKTKGVFWMLVSVLGFTFMGIAIKYLPRIPTYEKVFFRNSVSLMLSAFILFKQKESIKVEKENKRLEEQAKSKKEFMYWFIGLLVSTLLGILAIIVTILTTK